MEIINYIDIIQIIFPLTSETTAVGVETEGSG